LSFEDFPATSFYRFTLDVDDRVSASRGTMISGAEIAGSTVSVVMEDPSGQTVSMNGFFDQNSMAILSASCQRAPRKMSRSSWMPIESLI
jgi:glycine cleavage system regulatory protein